MKIYKYIFTGDEITNDTFTITDVPGQHCLIKVTGTLVTKNKLIEQLEGLNASAEEASEELVIDMIDDCLLQSVYFDVIKTSSKT